MRRPWSICGLLLQVWQAVAADKNAGDYYIKSLPGQPDGPLLKMHAGYVSADIHTVGFRRARPMQMLDTVERHDEGVSGRMSWWWKKDGEAGAECADLK